MNSPYETLNFLVQCTNVKKRNIDWKKTHTCVTIFIWGWVNERTMPAMLLMVFRTSNSQNKGQNHTSK